MFYLRYKEQRTDGHGRARSSEPTRVFGRAAICDELVVAVLSFSPGAVVVDLLVEYVVIQADVDIDGL